MAGSIGVRIGVDGEEKFRKDIAELTAQTKTYQAEMKALTASFTENETEQQKAAKTNKLLNEQLAVAKERTNLVREMTEQAIATYGKNSREALSWRTALASVTEQQAKLTKEAEKNKQTLFELPDIYKEYQEEISGVDQKARTLDAEMKALTSSFAENASAQEKTEAVAKLLNEQLETAKKRTELAAEAVNKSIEATGKDSEQTLKLREALSNAKTEENKLKQAVEENNKAISGQSTAMEAAAKKTVGFGDGLDKITGKLGIDIPDAAKNALNGMGDFSVGTVAKMGAAAGAVATVVKVAKELHEMTVEAGQWADDLLTRSAKTGLSTDLLQGLDNASKYLDFEGIDQSLVKLTASMDKAREGAEAQSAAFDALDVSVTNADGTLRSNWETFKDVIDSLGEIENATERDTIANDLFGQSYSELKPLIDAGTEALQEYMDQAKENGVVLTEDQIKILGEVDDAHQNLTDTIDAEKKKIAAEWAPASIASMDAFADATKKLGDAVIDSGLIENVATIIEHGAHLFQSATAIADKIPDWLKPIESAGKKLEFFNKILAGTANLLGITKNEMVGYDGLGSDVAGATWKSDVQAWVTAGGTIITPDNINNIDKATGKVTSEFYLGSFVPGDSAYSYGHMSEKEIQLLLKKAGYNAAGTDDWKGGWTWVGEGGPERVWLPQGSKIYSNQESREMAGGVTIGTVVIEARKIRELNDMVRIFNGAQIEGRMS